MTIYHCLPGLHERHRGGGRGDAEDLPERVNPHRHDPRDQPHLRQVPAVLQVQRWAPSCWWHLDLTIHHFFSPGSPLQPHQSNGGPNCNGNTSLSKPVSVTSQPGRQASLQFKLPALHCVKFLVNALKNFFGVLLSIMSWPNEQKDALMDARTDGCTTSWLLEFLLEPKNIYNLIGIVLESSFALSAHLNFNVQTWIKNKWKIPVLWVLLEHLNIYWKRWNLHLPLSFLWFCAIYPKMSKGINFNVQEA